jgi:hypothetical protein
MTYEKWFKIGKDLYEGGFNEICVFLNFASQPNWWYWPLENGKFNWKKVNRKYSDNVFNFIKAMAHWRISPKIKLNNDYHTGALDPFIQGLAPYDAEKHYSSVIKVWSAGKVKFVYTWIKWNERGDGTTPPPAEVGHKYYDYKAVSPFQPEWC